MFLGLSKLTLVFMSAHSPMVVLQPECTPVYPAPSRDNMLGINLA